MFDVIVFGATSFVGQIIARELCRLYPNTATFTWALAGRSQEKLDLVVAQLNQEFAPSAPITTLVADSHDEIALAAMCKQTKVVLSTVGPYALYGDTLLKICVDLGIGYCDLTGEPQWVARNLLQHEVRAKQTGARIVHSCGFDSIPSDLGVLHLQQKALAEHGQYCQQVQLLVKTMKGGASGGTAASIVNVIAEASTNRAVRKVLADPYALCTGASPRPTVKQDNQIGARFSVLFGVWTAPFVMAAINTRVVQRSHALQDYPYGKQFLYRESMSAGKGIGGQFRAVQMATLLGGFSVAAALPPLRALLNRAALPKPGEGPSREEQLAGRFDFRFLGTTPNGQTVRTKVTGDQDSGYGSTAKMIVQAAHCLVKTPLAGGIYTPATALGSTLISALQAHAGLNFE